MFSHRWMRHEVIWQCCRWLASALPVRSHVFGGGVALESDLQGGWDLMLSKLACYGSLSKIVCPAFNLMHLLLKFFNHKISVSNLHASRVPSPTVRGEGKNNKQNARPHPRGFKMILVIHWPGDTTTWEYVHLLSRYEIQRKGADCFTTITNT